MVSPLVSVIIPTYNRAKVLGRAIKSVLNQTYGKFELLIIDDGSVDNTKEIVEEFSDSRTFYFKHGENLGQNAALNTGLNIAKGEYISFLDSDDEWLPLMLEKQVKEFEQNRNLGVVYTWAGIPQEDGSLKPTMEFSLSGEIYKEALVQGYVSHMITVMVKRKFFDKIGLFDTQFTNCQDDDICLRLAKEYRFGLIPEILAIIHMDGGANLTRDSKRLAEGWWRLFSKHESEIIRVCGNKTMAKHYMKSGNLFLQARQFESARRSFYRAYRLSPSIRTLSYFIISRLPFPVLLFRSVQKLKIGLFVTKMMKSRCQLT